MPRLISLDALRGFTMFWIIGGVGIAEGVQRALPNRLTDAIAFQLEHTPWRGIRLYDCIWPAFMFMTGVSIALAHARRGSRGVRPLRVARRVIVLLLLGSLRESLHHGALFWIELSSALQPIAFASLVAFLLVRRRAAVKIAVGAAVLVGYGLLLALVPAPGAPENRYAPGGNLVEFVDLAVLGRVHPEHWGTLLSTIPTVSTTILGLLVGELLTSARPRATVVRDVAIIALGLIVLGFALDPVVPIIMKLWTSSYGLVSAGIACLLFLVFYWVVDVKGHQRWAFPFVVIGMNAIAIYVGQSLVRFSEIAHILSAPIVPMVGRWGMLFQAGVLLALEWVVLYAMYRRRLFLTA